MTLQAQRHHAVNLDVTIVDISSTSGSEIAESTETGLKMGDGKRYEFDIIALATGYDITTGGYDITTGGYDECEFLVLQYLL